MAARHGVENRQPQMLVDNRSVIMHKLTNDRPTGDGTSWLSAVACVAGCMHGRSPICQRVAMQSARIADISADNKIHETNGMSSRPIA